MSAIDEFFSELVKAEIVFVASDEILDEKLDCINFVGSTLIVAINVIDKHQLFSSNVEQGWIEERQFLEPFVDHVS